ncbi:MAG: cadmium carbonic anhydrase [Rhodobacteraceae bacterium]|nr:cadmium carbonic anhydrase [Paracoccaceae bacterium]
MTGFTLRHALFLALLLPSASLAQGLCTGFGPQAPRDIANTHGINRQSFSLAGPAESMNICNIHTHTNAEHKGPGFSIFAGEGPHGGFLCNETAELSAAELRDSPRAHGAYHGVKPGDTIEVHWVFTSCSLAPGQGLGACRSEETCRNPDLRVEAQVFLVVNDANAADFRDFAYMGNMVNGFHQPLSLPDAKDAVLYAGSTTGSRYSNTACSPYQATWSVRPRCMKVDIASLHAWAGADAVFQEEHSHQVRQLVTAPELLAPIR